MRNTVLLILALFFSVSLSNAQWGIKGEGDVVERELDIDDFQVAIGDATVDDQFGSRHER